ncbi:hypothetical protein IMCC9480_3408 [Oxalobacteraceae bacterium IMCC9480]|nr:hypothetical protein IMCC9480_3408 [Oxalobacteraceae bacterium IMCC9480]
MAILVGQANWPAGLVGADSQPAAVGTGQALRVSLCVIGNVGDQSVWLGAILVLVACEPGAPTALVRLWCRAVCALPHDADRLTLQVAGDDGALRRIAAITGFDDGGAAGCLVTRYAGGVVAGGDGVGQEAAATVVVKQGDIGIRRRASGAVGQRAIELHQQATAVDTVVAVSGLADDCLRSTTVAGRSPSGFGYRKRLADVVIGDVRDHFSTRHHARTGYSYRCRQRARRVLVTYQCPRRSCCAIPISAFADRQRPAVIIALCLRRAYRHALVIKLGRGDFARQRVIAEADIGGTAQAAAGAAGFEDAVFSGDAGVLVDGGLAEAVGQDGGAGGRVGERDAVDVVGMRGQDGAAVCLIAEGGQALGDDLTVSFADDADAGQAGRMLRVFVMVLACDGAIWCSGWISRSVRFGRFIADLVVPTRKIDTHQISHQHDRGDRRARRQGAAVAVTEAADRAVNILHAGKLRLTAALPVRPMQAQLPVLRIGHLHELAVAVIEQADELPAWRDDLNQIATIVEHIGRAVGAVPEVFVAIARCPADRHGAVGRIGGLAQRTVERVATKHQARAVGQHNLNTVADGE